MVTAHVDAPTGQSPAEASMWRSCPNRQTGRRGRLLGEQADPKDTEAVAALLPHGRQHASQLGEIQACSDRNPLRVSFTTPSSEDSVPPDGWRRRVGNVLGGLGHSSLEDGLPPVAADTAAAAYSSCLVRYIGQDAVVNGTGTSADLSLRIYAALHNRLRAPQ